MKRWWLCVIVIMLLVGLSPSAMAKKKHKKKVRSLVTVDTVMVKATVAAIDPASHTLTLKGTKGALLPLRVDQSVKNFDLARIGDKVVVRYLESTALSLDRAQGQPVAPVQGAIQLAVHAAKPMRVSVAVVGIKATVETINYDRRTMTLRGPEGKAFPFRIDKRIKDVRSVRAGDEVVVHYTESLVISLEKQGG
ncbi:MAG TPA: hypothetical protein DCZ69_11880 [Syntrophobacteraceae bacterium]|nr:hypothetical protein [Syntrophobacteraceae bacterium]HBD08950.1 hypothetical protein [Syntrophobacteraceae bacterium]HBZ56737.1 hypothetical protein [Syntrophobacteraceae bacterium]